MQDEHFGFAPDELDLAHLDQTQTKEHVPLPHEPGLSHAGPEKLSSKPQSLRNKTVPQQLTHLDSHGRAQMVDVGQVPLVKSAMYEAASHFCRQAAVGIRAVLLQKMATFRTATASATVQLSNDAFTAIATDGKVAKGDALTVAQLAGSLHTVSTKQFTLSSSCKMGFGINDGKAYGHYH